MWLYMESTGPAVHMLAGFEFSGTRSTYIVLFLLKVSGQLICLNLRAG